MDIGLDLLNMSGRLARLSQNLGRNVNIELTRRVTRYGMAWCLEFGVGRSYPNDERSPR